MVPSSAFEFCVLLKNKIILLIDIHHKNCIALNGNKKPYIGILIEKER